MAIQWNSEKVQQQILLIVQRRLHAAAIVVMNHAKELVGREGAYPALKGTKGRRKGSLVYGAVRSLPGEPPRKQTGRLQSSISYVVNGLTARIGSGVRYARPLEFGSPKTHLAARPWLRRALREKLGEVRRILKAPIGSFTNPIDVTFRD